MGGTVGLFLGASILSFIEILYYLFLRTYSFNKENMRDEHVDDSGANRSFVKANPTLSPFISELVFQPRKLQIQRQNALLFSKSSSHVKNLIRHQKMKF